MTTHSRRPYVAVGSLYGTGSRSRTTAPAPKEGQGVRRSASLRWAETFERRRAAPDYRASPTGVSSKVGRSKSAGPPAFRGHESMFDFDALDDADEPSPEPQLAARRPASPARISGDAVFDFDALAVRKPASPARVSGDAVFDFDALEPSKEPCKGLRRPAKSTAFAEPSPSLCRSPARVAGDAVFDFDALDEVSVRRPTFASSKSVPSLSLAALESDSVSSSARCATDRRHSCGATTALRGSDSELDRKLAKRRSAVEAGEMWLYENFPASPARAGARGRSVDAVCEAAPARPLNTVPLPSARLFPAAGGPRDELTRTLSGRFTHVDRYGDVVQSAGCRPSREVDARSSLVDESADMLERHGVGGAMAFYAEKRTATFDFMELDLEESRM